MDQVPCAAFGNQLTVKQQSAVQKASTEKHSKSALSAWLVPTVAILFCLLFGALPSIIASKSADKRNSTKTIPVSDSSKTTASPAYDAPDATAESSNYIDSLQDGNGSTARTVTFDTPANLDAVSITPTIAGGYSWTEWPCHKKSIAWFWVHLAVEPSIMTLNSWPKRLRIC